jgi:superfamily II DNA or RNA helicase
MDYISFIHAKLQEGADTGFDPVFMPDNLFDFQQHLVEWAVRKGRAALFADTGLGKSAMQSAWAQNVHQHTNRPVLILTPVAVAEQAIREAAKFGVEAHRSRDGKANGITVTNYEMLHKFNPADYAGVVCDESSILKSFDGARKQAITDFMRKVPYRLLATATAAPNDYTELGTSSEALGYLGHMDMLSRFFKNDQNNNTSRRMYGEAVKWRFKGHAEQQFWRWVCSWARAIRKPSDIGFDDQRFILPRLIENQHIVESDFIPDDKLFAMPAITLREQREERRKTIEERCRQVADLVDHDRPALVWAHLNDEADRLAEIIPGAVQVSGSDDDDTKERRFLGFADGTHRVLVTKPKIGAWGLNFQHCNHVTFFPSHSFEQYYQGVRRCWRFGQTKDVTVDVVSTEGESRVLENLQRKAESAAEMFANLVDEMNHAISLQNLTQFNNQESLPSWLS